MPQKESQAQDCGIIWWYSWSRVVGYWVLWKYFSNKRSVYFFSDEEFPPFTPPPSDTKPPPFASSFQNPFLDNSESSSFDLDLELGGCEYNYEYLSEYKPSSPPSFDFCMFSFPSSKPSPEARIVEIDAKLGSIPPFEYILRQSLREEKNKLLREVKGKSSAPSFRPSCSTYHIYSWLLYPSWTV